MSIFNTSIDDFSFLANAPNLERFSLTYHTDNTDEIDRLIAKVIRETCQEKDKEIVSLKQQITQLQTLIQQSIQDQQTIANLNQTLVQLNNTNSQLNQQNFQQQQTIIQLQTELSREKDKGKHLLEQLTQVEQPPK